MATPYSRSENFRVRRRHADRNARFWMMKWRQPLVQSNSCRGPVTILEQQVRDMLMFFAHTAVKNSFGEELFEPVWRFSEFLAVRPRIAEVSV